MSETYYDSAKSITIGIKRVCQELNNHGQGFQGIVEFFIDHPNQTQFKAQSVLDWLGY